MDDTTASISNSDDTTSISSSDDVAEDDYSIGGSDDEIDYTEHVYESDEPSLTKFNIVLCERYTEFSHCLDDEEQEVANHYLTIIRLKKFDLNKIQEIATGFVRLVFIIPRLEIAQCMYLKSMHCVSIIKTLWIKIIQRRWKKVFKERQQCLMNRCKWSSITHRTIYGTWPSDCILNSTHGIQGMLYELSRTSRTRSTTA